MISLRERDGSATVIALRGAVDRAEAGELREVTARVAESGAPVVIEMSEVTDLATPVVGVLVSAWHALSDRLTLHCSEPVHATLEETGLDRLLPVSS